MPEPVTSPANTSWSTVKLWPCARSSRVIRATSGSFTCTGRVSTLVSTLPSGVVSRRSMVCTPTPPAVTGTSNTAVAWSPRSKPEGTAPRVTPCAVTSSPIRPEGPVAWTTSSSNRLSSPGDRNRGRLAVTTTGSRTSTSALACPTPVLDHATAITLSVPLKLGRSKLTRAVPSAPTSTGPVK